jgi:selenium-binding protein 1
MAMNPDPTFYPSPKLAMEGPPEEFAFTALLSGDSSEPDALAIIDVKRGSPTYSQVVHTVTMPYKGDEFHHFGWNACSSALSPLTGHAFLERRYLIIPGIRSSRVYVVDTKPHPTQAKIHKIIEPEEIFKKTGYSRPHTVHCGPEGIYVSALGGGGKDGADGPPGVFIMDCETFEILGRWEIDRGPQKLHYDFCGTCRATTWCRANGDCRRNSRTGSSPKTCSRTNTATISISGICGRDATCRRSISAPITRWRSKSARRTIRCANMAFWAS